MDRKRSRLIAAKNAVVLIMFGLCSRHLDASALSLGRYRFRGFSLAKRVFTTLGTR